MFPVGRLWFCQYLSVTVVGKFNGINAVEACSAQVWGGYAAGIDERVKIDECQCVRVDGPADFIGRQSIRNQLGARREIDAVKTRPLDRWARDAHMHLSGTGLAEHAHQGTLGVTPDDRIVHDYQSLTLDDITQRVEFQANTQLTDSL